MNLAMQFKFPLEAERQIQDAFRKCEGEWVLDSLIEYTTTLGERQPDGSKFYHKDPYAFTFKLGEVSVSLYPEGIEIFNNKGYTPLATNKDKRNMFAIDRMVNQFEKELQTKRQELKQNLSPKL